MFKKNNTKISLLILFLFIFNIFNSVSYADDQLDVKNHINNMRNSTYESGILGDIFIKIFDTEGKIKEAFLSIINSATNGYLPMWDNLQLINSPLFFLAGKIGIGTITPSEVLTISGGLSITKDPDSGDDVGNRDYNDARNDARYLGLFGTASNSNLLDSLDSTAFQKDIASFSCGYGIASVNDDGSVVCAANNNTDTQLTEAEVDAYVENNGYLTSFTDTNAETICGSGTFLNGDGTCDTGYLDSDGVDDIDGGNADTIDGIDSTGFLLSSASEFKIADTRDDGDVTPDGFTDKKVKFSFTDEISGSPNAWDSVMTVAGWSNSYIVWQLLSGSSNSIGDDNLHFRTGIGSIWGTLRTIWDSGNDGAGSGLDSDLLDGQQGSYYLDNTDTQLTEAEVDAYVSDNGYLTSVADNRVNTTGDTMTGDLGFTSGDYMSFESGKHWITNNDGKGNFNIRVGNDKTETITENGYAFHTEWGQSNGKLQWNISQNGLVGDLITWNNTLQFSPSGLTVDGNTVYHIGNSPYDTEAEIDAAVANNGYDTTPDTIADDGTIDSSEITDNTITEIDISDSFVARDSSLLNGLSSANLIQQQGAVALTSANDLNSLSDGWYKWTSNLPINAPGAYMIMVQQSDPNQKIQMAFGSSGYGKIYVRRADSGTFYSWTNFWNSENDGTGSGLDADLIDGLDSISLQKRVTGTCGVGSSIRTINTDGTVVCETDDTGGGVLNTRSTCYWSSVVYASTVYCNTGYFVAGMNYVSYGGGYSGHKLYCCKLTLN